MKRRIKNGFTLIEILITVSILVLLFLITLPSLMTIYNNIGSRSYRYKKTLILEAAKLYGSDNLGSFNDSKLQINVSNLIKDNYLSPDVSYGENGCGDNYGCIMNPDNSLSINNMCIMITNQGENFNADWTECKEGPYRIVINTNEKGSIRKNSEVNYKNKLEYKVYKGSDITFEYIESKEGYHYSNFSCTGGSFSSTTLNNQITLTDISGDLRCTTTFDANKYIITFDGNGSTGGSTEDVECTYDEDCTLSINGFSRTNYEFGGWARNPNGVVDYQNEGVVKNLASSGKKTLYAKWRQIPTITPEKTNITVKPGIKTWCTGTTGRCSVGIGSTTFKLSSNVAGTFAFEYDSTLLTVSYDESNSKITLTQKSYNKKATDTTELKMTFTPNDSSFVTVTKIYNVTILYAKSGCKSNYEWVPPCSQSSSTHCSRWDVLFTSGSGMGSISCD